MVAIPSPDVVINLLASLGQLLAFMSILVGGTAVSMRRKDKARDKQTSQKLFWATAGLALTSTIAFMLYFSYVQDLKNARLRTNLVRSSIENGRTVGDDSLVTLSYSDQKTHRAGLSTKDLKAALDAGLPLNIIDIRESEEVEGGHFPNSWHVRYPDLKHNRKGLVREGAQTVLMCFSGNRSSELAVDFLNEGVDCKFVIGGYEKWISEGGLLELGDAASRKQLRELPAVPNSDVLLDTPDVSDAIATQEAVFVDVRYPGDFEHGHLPGAINLPIRMLPTEELEERLAALPKGPVIVACYDKRSSFYGSILGIRLHRIGRTFLGRYTVPHEFLTGKKTRAHVTAWNQQRAGMTPFGVIKGWLTKALGSLEALCGGLALAILLLVLLVRGLISPLSFKSDLDQWRRLNLDPEVKKLKAQFANDPARAQRGIVELYRNAKMSPIRNLVVSIGQLLLFLAFFAVIQAAAVGSTETFLGLWTLGVADALFILPIAVGILMAAIVLNGAITKKKLVLATILMIGLSALTWALPAAANLYLVTSLIWVVIQNRLARFVASRSRQRTAEDLKEEGVVTFREAARAAGAGNKAIRLGAMLEVGLPVPNGFSLTDKALQQASRDGRLSNADRRRISRLHRALNTDRVAVRSSGLKEDGGKNSYAGVFESVLNVPKDKLFEAIEFVHSSMDSDRARAYGDGDEQGGIVVQTMVQAEFAGVMFTEHPGHAGKVMIELVEGLCEDLVGGAVTPQAFEFTRVSHRRLGDDVPAIDLGPLLELGRQVETLFGGPQDIEWAYSKGRFFLLQARDITVGAGSGNSSEALRERELSRLFDIVRDTTDPEDTVFAQNELSELLPNPTPFSLSFMNDLWAAGGSVDIACRSMGIPYNVEVDGNDYVVDVFGKLFVDRREEKRRLSVGMGGMASFRLTRGADALEKDFREHHLPAFHKRMRVLEATDVTRLNDIDLFGLWRDVRSEFVTSTYVEAERINIAADYFVKTATSQLEKRGHNPGAALANIPETVVHRAFQMLPSIKNGDAKASDFTELFGHRAQHDFEFSEPRYSEAPDAVEALAKMSSDAGHPGPKQDPEFGRVLSISVDRARRFQALKEEAKHEAMRELAVFRALTLEIGRRLGLNEDILWLRPDEVAQLSKTGANGTTAATIEERMNSHESFETIEMPVRIAVSHLEALGSEDVVIPRPEASGDLAGKRVAGAKEVVGRVRVVRKTEELESFEPGEILVARFTDPTWSTVFTTAGGLITEVGGWLSHAAIQAREYGLACIVDVNEARSILKTGQIVRLCLDGSIEQLAEGAVTTESGRILRFDGTTTELGVDVKTTPSMRKNAQ